MCYKKVILLMFAGLCSLNGAGSNEFFQNGKEGWFYFKDDVIESEKDKKDQNLTDQQFMKSIPLGDLSSLSAKEYQETFTKAKEIAVMNPTKENVQIVQMMNKFQTEQSEKYAKIWMVNSIENPDLEYPEIGKDKFSRSAQFHQKEKDTEAFFEKHKNDLGYVVFYNLSNEMAFKRQQIVFDSIVDKYGIAVEYFNTDENPELVKNYKLASSIENFFVYKNSKNEAIWMRVKSGLANQEEIIKNTVFLFDNAIMEKDK